MKQNLNVCEWLDTNRFGSYASSTLSGCHTRKYHGLLVARLSHPPGKYVLLSKIEDSLFFGDKELFLTTHQYPGELFPAEGLPTMTFSTEPVPTFTYQTANINIQKEVAVLAEQNAVLVRYTCTKNSVSAMLRAKPLLAYRDFHSVIKENLSLRERTFPLDNGFLVSPYDGMPAMHIQTNGRFEFSPSPMWYRNFEYLEEMRRGFDFVEDLFCPGVVEIEIEKGDSLIISASTSLLGDLNELWEKEISRRKKENKKLQGTPFQKSLKRAAMQFVTQPPNQNEGSDTEGTKAITAGYHWFAEWGRDAMIALPGLLLPLNQTDVYLDVLKRYGRNCRNGIIPNYLGEHERDNAYNSADAGLWYGFAVQKYLEHMNSPRDLVGDIAKTLYNIYDHYKRGTDHGIRMLENGLLHVGGPNEQVTWMDAMVDGRPVTPRFGSPVEINALWYNFVSFLAESGPALAMRDTVAIEAAQLAKQIKKSFIDTFWLSDADYLADLKQGERLDRSNRPNQIFAASLPFSPLSANQTQKMLAKVQQTLLTPLGLRTLDPDDPHYRGRYEGNSEDRDNAYHNGTVWPWLLGHFGEALLKHSKNKSVARAVLNECMAAFEDHLEDAGFGTISEIFDGDAPQGAQGCVSQAWSVAEILRLSILLAAAS